MIMYDHECIYTDPPAMEAGGASCERRLGFDVSTTNSFTLVRFEPACNTNNFNHNEQSKA